MIAERVERSVKKNHAIERLLSVIFGHFMVTINGQTMFARRLIKGHPAQLTAVPF